MMAFHAFEPETSYLFLASARTAGMSEDAFMNHLLQMVATTDVLDEADIPYAQALEEAVKRAKAKKPGDEFRLEQLFTEEEWKRVQAKKHVGRFFRTEAEHKVVEHIGKTETNHAIYRRI